MSQREAGASARERLVGAVSIGHDDAVVAVEHLAGRVLRAALQDRVRDRVFARDGPRPPAFALRAAEQAPPGFIRADDRRREHVPLERVVRRLQHGGQGLDLIPQRLGLDRQPFPRHHPRLTFERLVIHVLVDRDLDREHRRIPPAADVGPAGQAQRAGRRVDAAVAAASVLLPPMLQPAFRSP